MRINSNDKLMLLDNLENTSKRDLLEYISYLYNVIYDEEGCEGKELIDQKMRDDIENIYMGYYYALMYEKEIN